VEPAAEFLFTLGHTVAPLAHRGNDRAGDGTGTLARNRHDLFGAEVLDGPAYSTLSPHGA
jgi:hypothetical protein